MIVDIEERSKRKEELEQAMKLQKIKRKEEFKQRQEEKAQAIKELQEEADKQLAAGEQRLYQKSAEK